MYIRSYCKLNKLGLNNYMTYVYIFKLLFCFVLLVVDASAYEAYVVGPGGIRIIDTDTDSVVATLAENFSHSLVVTSDGKRIYGAYGQNVCMIDTDTRKLSYPVQLPNTNEYSTNYIKLSKTGTRLYVLSAFPNQITIIDIQTHSIVACYELDFQPFSTMRAPDGPSFVLSQDERFAYIIHNEDNSLISIIDLNTGEKISTFTLQWTYYDAYGRSYLCTWKAYVLSLSPDGKHLYSLGIGNETNSTQANKMVQFIEINQETNAIMLKYYYPIVKSNYYSGLYITYSTDGQKLYIVSDINQTQVYDINGRVFLNPSYAGYFCESYNMLAFTPDGEYIYYLLPTSLEKGDAKTGAILATYQNLVFLPVGIIILPNTGPIPGTVSQKNNGQCSCPSAYVGNPINAGTGNKFESAVDYEGAGHTGLSLTRYYNSMDTESSPFGAKWRSTWHRKATQSNASTVKVTREDGRVDTFTFNGSAWVSDPDVQSRLTGSASSGWQLVREDDSTESYAADGRLLSVTTRPGLVTTLAYDASNRLASVTGPFGHAMSFAYDASNRVAAVTLPDGKTVIYGYDANNNLVSVTYPDSKSRRYVYENATFPNAMTGIVDEKGVRFATYAYDAKGRTVSSEHANGAGRVAIDYASATTSTVTDARGNQSAYDLTKIFDVIRPASMTKNCCGGADYAYDSNGFLASRTDFNGNVTTYVHNARGLETSRTDASGTAQARTINTEWHSTLRLPTKITEPNRVTTFAYDANGNMVQKAVVETGGKIRTWTYTYNAKGQVLTVNGPRTDASDITKYAYDTKGNLTSVTDALGMITKITSYDPNGRPLIVVDPNGLTTKFAYDARGRVVSLTEGTEKTSYAYDAAGNLTKATLPDGSYLAYVYDDAHRLTSVMDALGNRKVFTLDGEGNRTKEEVFDAHGSLQETRTRVFDQVNRLHQVIGATGQTTVIEHDANGNITSVTDPLGNVAMNGYDALNRLIQSTNPDTGIVRYAYNTDDKVTKVTDPRNLATAYTLNGLGDLTAIKSPDSGSTTNVYDAAGNLTATTDARGKKTIYTYDALNRLKTEKYADGRTVTYTYDNATNAKGRLTKIADPSGNTVFTYDQHGRETKRVQTIGTLVFTTSRTYDAYGRPSSITYPSGQKATMNYDVVSGKPSAILVNGKRLVSNIHYRPFGPVAGWLAGNGQGHERAFDLDGRLSGVEAGSSYLWLTYDDAGRITGQQEDLFSSKDYAYDSMSRILTASGGAMERSYLYDANGNRLLQETETGVTNYFYAAASNRLLSATGEKAQTNSFDAAGNLLKDGMATFTVDASGRVNSAKVNSVTTTYTHNALGQRVSKKNASGTPFQNFVYDRNGELLGAYNQSKASIEETVWLEGMPIGVIKSGVLYHVTPGHLKQPHHITNSVGKRVWQWNTDPFGNGSPNQNPQGAGTFTYSLRFPGQVYDSETGLHYNYYRTYDPETGRYTQVDPIGLNGGINPYVYVGGNPVSGVDLFGLKAYFVNRDLNLPLIINKSAEPRWDFLTHTFVVTTNNDGTISHTYSWGNEANRNGWNLDEPLDIATAKDAIKEKLAEPIVDNVIGPFLLDENSLDPFIDEAFNILKSKDLEHSNLYISSNCKEESVNLINMAKRLRFERMMQQLQILLIESR